MKLWPFSNNGDARRVRYGVVGLGHIAQNAVLPAFANAKENSELRAIFSSEPRKLREIGDSYDVPHRFSYDEYDAALQRGLIDAVYIALPNDMHRDFTIRAARAGVHILCEKPMAMTVEDCQAMVAAAKSARVRLMIAYRLHFERTNLEAIQVLRDREIGEPRFFNATFSMQVKQGNVRLSQTKGGGTLYDIGIYCINAARYLFRAEPTEVAALSVAGGKRFAGVDEMTAAVLRFPDERLAQFTTSFGAADTSMYEVVGTKGRLRVEPAYDYEERLSYVIRVGEHERRRTFNRRDQFGPELVYFSNCVLNGVDPEPSGQEGLADVRVIEAIYESARTGKAVAIRAHAPRKRPAMTREIHRRPVKKKKYVGVSGPRRGAKH